MLRTPADLETHQADAVASALREAAYLPMITVQDPARPNIPLLSPRGRIIGVRVHEQSHRLQIRPAAPSHGLRAANRTGEPAASVSIRWMLCPDNFEPLPGREPPPTELDPSRSQRFVMLDGEFRFNYERAGMLSAFGHGRTFPAIVNGQPVLRLGSVISSLYGTGQVAAPGAINTVTGVISPPGAMQLHFLWRIMDSSRSIQSDWEPGELHEHPDPSPDTTVIALLGETDPDRPVTLITGPGSMPIGSNVVERLRLVSLDWRASSIGGIRSVLRIGPVIGSLSGKLSFQPFAGATVIPISTSEGRFTFWNFEGRGIGELFANIEYGQAFPIPLAPAPVPVFKFSGFGRLLGGTGCFANATGMLALNAAVSVFPRTLSNLYLLRLDGPKERFRATSFAASL